MEQESKLKIELVPGTCFYSNVRNLVSRRKWDEIRRKAYRNAGYKCEICGADNVKLHCHEIWSYDEENHVQNLEGLPSIMRELPYG